MKRLLILLAIAIQFFHSWSQDRSEIWVGAGLKREVATGLVLAYQSNARYSTTNNGFQTLFQELSIKSEHIKWFRPSFDYRFVTSYALNGNTTYSNRFNINIDFRKKTEQFKFGLRARYQLSIGNSTTSGGDLDPAIRFKPYIQFMPKKGRISPELSAEFFYNPVYEYLGRQFNRTRYGLTLNIDLPGPNELGITYYYGQKFNSKKTYQEHLVSLEYCFEWKKEKKSSGNNSSKTRRYL